MKRRKIKIYSKVEIPTSPNESVNLENLNIRQVVADDLLSDPFREISLSDAKKIKNSVEIGDSIIFLVSRNYVFHRHHGVDTIVAYEQLNIEEEKLCFTQSINQPFLLSKEEICSKKGWTDFTFRFLRLLPHKLLGDKRFYKSEIINNIEESSNYQRYLETVKDIDEMLKWYNKTDMTKWELLDAFVFTIPEMPKEALIINACYSYNDYIDSNPSYEGVWIDDEWYGPTYADPEKDDDKKLAVICRNYLRHRHTPYDYLLQLFCNWRESDSEAFHDELQNKINSAIIKVYPWLDTYHKKYFR